MYREGHLGLAFLAYAPVAFALSYVGAFDVLALGLAGMAVASYAPDVDSETVALAHRGPTHTFLAGIALGLGYAAVAVGLASLGVGQGAAFVIREPSAAFVAAAVFGFVVGALGFCTHLLGDVITPMGVAPWWPWADRRYSLNLVLSSNRRVNAALLLTGTVTLLAAVAAGVAFGHPSGFAPDGVAPSGSDAAATARRLFIIAAG